MDSFPFVLLILTLSHGASGSICTSSKQTLPENALERLKPLMGHRFETKDFTGNGDIPADHYSYEIGICADADEAESSLLSPGVIQTDSSGAKKVVGRYNETEIMAGTNWIMIEYEGGDHFGSHCAKEARRANIFITCNLKEKNGIARVLEENNDKTNDCYYLFEIEHIAACPEQPAPGLSAGAVVVIVLLMVFGLYFFCGFLFQRYYRGAKGLEQIPNFSVWRYVGNLSADGCNYVCRCGVGEDGDSARQYRPVGDNNVPSNNIDYSTVEDENLLPM